MSEQIDHAMIARAELVQAVRDAIKTLGIGARGETQSSDHDYSPSGSQLEAAKIIVENAPELATALKGLIGGTGFGIR